MRHTVRNAIERQFQTASNLRYGFAIPRRDASEIWQKPFAQEREGAGNAGCPLHPKPRVRNKMKHTSVVTTGSDGFSPAFPAQWFYGLFRALPGDEFVLSPSSTD